MKNETFDKWWSEEYSPWHTYNTERDRCVANIAFTAGQSESAARIAELEAESWAETIITVQEKNQGLQQRIAELEEEVERMKEVNLSNMIRLTADCKAMAEEVIKSSRHNGLNWCVDKNGAYIQKDKCPACTIAAKYGEGK